MFFARDFSEIKPKQRSLICLGNFDGLHAGHQATMHCAVQLAKERSLSSILFTFWPHPRKVLPTQTLAPHLIFTQEEKESLFKKLSFDYVLFQNFDIPFSEITHQKFVSDILLNHLHAKHIVVGKNFRFGNAAKGDTEYLAQVPGLKVKVMEYIRQTNESVVNSSAIRKEIEAGEIELANGSLGYSYFMTGTIKKGDERGKNIGFSTANLLTEKECLPQTGVYFTILEDLESKNFYAAITNLGYRPTFKGSSLEIETHLLKFSDNLYHRRVRLHFLKKHRNEINFDSPQQLASQIGRDVKICHDFFKTTQYLAKNFEDSDVLYHLGRGSLENFQTFEMTSNLFSTTD